MRYLFFFILFGYTTSSFGQMMEGMVLDNDTKDPVQGATVINKHNNNIVTTDVTGHYSIFVGTGDTVVFSHTAYKTFTEVVPFSIGTRHKTILMTQRVYKLKETTVTGLTKYQEDSINTREEYKQGMRQEPGKVNNYYGLGVVSEGLISRWVGNITGYNKKQKRFKDKLREGEKTKFIDTRYTPKLVKQLTPLKGDSVAYFMNAYPMPYDFARAATDLEIKAWIKNNYRDYLVGKPHK